MASSEQETGQKKKSVVKAVLPLPEAPALVGDKDGEIERTWRSVNVFYVDIRQAQSKDVQKTALQRYGIHILLACQLLQKGLKAIIPTMAGDSAEQNQCYHMLKLVIDAFKWLRPHPVIVEFFRWESTSKSSMARLIEYKSEISPAVAKVAVENAQAIYQAIRHAGHWTADTRYVELAKLRTCELIWQNICQFLKSNTGEQPMKTKDALKILENIKRMVQDKESADSSLPGLGETPRNIAIHKAHVPAKPEIPKGGDILPGIFTGGLGIREKKRRTGDSRTALAPRLTQEQVMAKNQIVGEPECLAWYDKGCIIAKPKGLLQPPCSISPSEMISLIGRDWITDQLTDCYLALVCHLGNGHFKLDDDAVTLEQAGSPQWHSWTTWLSKGLQSRGALTTQWPPRGYSGAKIEDTQHHIFPMHLRNNHWGLAVLSLKQGSQNVDFYSSLGGYDQDFVQEWRFVVEHLFRISGGKVDVRDLRYSKPPQPRQGNDSDCGPFILCISRWLVEGWPLDTLVQADMNHLRRCMAGQLERWSFQ